MLSLHIHQQLYKNLQKLDPFSGSCRVQLVTRDLAREEALNSSHVALPVHCGFGDFIRVGQLLPLVRLHKDQEGSGGRGPGEFDCKSGPPGCWSFRSSFSLLLVISISGKGEGGRWKYVTPCLFMKPYHQPMPHSQSSGDAGLIDGCEAWGHAEDMCRAKISTKCIYCCAATVWGACICDAHKYLFIYLFQCWYVCSFHCSWRETEDCLESKTLPRK